MVEIFQWMLLFDCIMSEITYLNSPDLCMICFGKPEVENDGNSTRTLKLIKHHIEYSPETIIWVHYKCHQKIHDVDNPMTVWIRYTEEEKNSFTRTGSRGARHSAA